MKTDVAIIGAGPAGSSAAHKLAASGVRVALLERDAFPRDKVCGDAVSGRGLAILEQIGLGEWSEQFLRPRELRLVSPDTKSVFGRAASGDTHCYGRLIPRSLLDEKLAQAAVQAGARLLEETRVTAIEPNDETVRVLTEETEVTAQLAILCDGSHAPITRQLGLARGQPELIAVRQYLAGDPGPQERMDVHFERAMLPHYTWVFPLGDGEINAGMAAYAKKARKKRINLREELTRFVTAREGRLAQAEPIGPILGHPLRARFGDPRQGTRTHTTRVLVAGDAAGLVNPLSGEGIAQALESGEMAAAHAQRALAAGDLSTSALAAYSRELETRYRADWRAARILRLALSRPSLINRVFRNMRQDEELARLVGTVIIGHRAPRAILRPRTMLRLLI